MTSRRVGLAIAALIGALMTAAASCDDRRGAGGAVDSPEARRLDGAWAIELRVDRLRFEPVTARAGRSPSIRGEIALVANHWLEGADDLPHPTHYGSYDIDFRTLGFDPRHPGEYPRVAASIGGRDSIDIVLEPDDAHESVHLHGAWRGDSIVGRWSLEPVRAGGDAAGTYTMARRIDD
jgi:hypothetical protein